MRSIYIALGKIGDILNVLPILYHEYRQDLAPPHLLIAKEYARIFKQLSYVKVIEYTGHWQDLIGAIKICKQMYEQVVPLVAYGKDFPFQKKTPSFLMEPWERVGMLKEWDTLPLVIDGRNHQRERDLCAEHVPPNHPYILYADHGESSPFPHKEALAQLLRDVFPSYVILRLSEVRAENFLDLITLFEQAELIVATETSHLHLTAAATTPVIAFTKDTPSRWHGTPYCKRFRFVCRYSEFELRRHELIWALQTYHTGAERINYMTMVTWQRHGYNPTSMDGFPGIIYRHHPDKSWKTKLRYKTNAVELPVNFPEQFDGMSMEDARLFVFNGKVHISFTIARQELGQSNCVVGYGELGLSGDQAIMPKVHIPEFGHNHWGGMEKNWLFFEHDGRLMCIYGVDAEQIVLEVRGNKVWSVFRSEPHEWAWGKIRGGALVPWKGRLLRFFHSHTTAGPREKWVYSIGALTMEAKPPFQILQMSKQPIIVGDEKLDLHCRHWKQNVVFPGGVRQVNGDFHLAYGYNDCECRVAVISEKDLNL